MLIYSQLFSQLNFTMKEGYIYIFETVHNNYDMCYHFQTFSFLFSDI